MTNPDPTGMPPTMDDDHKVRAWDWAQPERNALGFTERQTTWLVATLIGAAVVADLVWTVLATHTITAKFFILH